MGIVIAFVGTLLVWYVRISESGGALWPSILATIGFWTLGILLHVLRRGRRGRSR